MSAGRKFEVEHKYRVKRRHFQGIQADLIKMRFAEIPTRQKDTYLSVPDKKLTRRVREEIVEDGGIITGHLRGRKRGRAGASGVKKQIAQYIGAGQRTAAGEVCNYYLTDKRKVHSAGGNTNDESERRLAVRSYVGHLAHKLLVRGLPVVVKKRRVHFLGVFEGMPVTVCLDRARGPRKIKLGHFVELEIEVTDKKDIPRAHTLLDDLRDEILPRSARREYRGYRTMLLDSFAEMARRLKRRKKRGKRR